MGNISGEKDISPLMLPKTIQDNITSASGERKEVYIYILPAATIMYVELLTHGVFFSGKKKDLPIGKLGC